MHFARAIVQPASTLPLSVPLVVCVTLPAMPQCLNASMPQCLNASMVAKPCHNDESKCCVFHLSWPHLRTVAAVLRRMSMCCSILSSCLLTPKVLTRNQLIGHRLRSCARHQWPCPLTVML